MAEPAKRRIAPLWKKLALSVTSLLLFFLVLEVTLAAVGVKPVTHRSDPLVGFASSSPLFVPEQGPDGSEYLVTAPGKVAFFNPQRFPRNKPARTRRVFCLGGSTTYGRPYGDTSSFAGWLRQLLPLADPDRRWEVINAGGISYASYRVAALMEELVRYEPDLFIVYTGHNEFLEERTYGSLREIPAPLKRSISLLSRTRTWAALSLVLGAVDEPSGSGSGYGEGEHSILPERVNTKLDRAAGLDLYERDDLLQQQVLAHYRTSLERIVRIAREADVSLIFVTPASNLKDCSPFKSQSTKGAGGEGPTDLQPLLDRVATLEREARWQDVLAALESALATDRRHAELQFQRGRALAELGRYEEAKTAFQRARDEDVCPLRALSEMRHVLMDVAGREDVPLVDFIAVLERRMQSEHGHTILGEEYFLDHVHPTIEGHRILAIELVQAMANAALLSISQGWTEEAIAEVTSRVEGGLDQDEHARALAKLALVLDWAGKDEDSRRLAFQALELGSEDSMILAMVARHYAMQGNTDEALRYFRRSLTAEFRNPSAHFQIGLLLQGRGEPEGAAAHLFVASALAPDDERAHRHLGSIMLQRGNYKGALTSFLAAQRLNPQNEDLAQRIAALRSRLGPAALGIETPKTGIVQYPSGAPRVFSQAQLNPEGRHVSDGIRTEWYENGGLKRFADYVDNVPHGVEVSWGPSGQVQSRAEYREGVLVKNLD